MEVLFQNKRLREQRKEKHITQEQLAEHCNCSARYLRDLELGAKRNPSGKLIQQIAQVLEISSEELLVVKIDEQKTGT